MTGAASGTDPARAHATAFGTASALESGTADARASGTASAGASGFEEGEEDEDCEYVSEDEDGIDGLAELLGGGVAASKKKKQQRQKQKRNKRVLPTQSKQRHVKFLDKHEKPSKLTKVARTRSALSCPVLSHCTRVCNETERS